MYMYICIYIYIYIYTHINNNSNPRPPASEPILGQTKQSVPLEHSTNFMSHPSVQQTRPTDCLAHGREHPPEAWNGLIFCYMSLSF